MIVITFHTVLIAYQDRIDNLPSRLKYLVQSLGLVVFMWFNYQIVGAIDQGLGGLPVYDGILMKADEYIFNGPIAVFFQKKTLTLLGDRGRRFLYDVLMVSYLLYYFLPFIASFLYMEKGRKAGTEGERMAILLERSKFLASVFILCILTFTFYLIVPVTGPQYFLASFFEGYEDLPFSSLGKGIYDFIYSLHPNYIDCFPSGHAGTAFLVCFWMYKGGLRERHLFMLVTILITLSTVLLRFHYSLDILASVPFAFISYVLGNSFFTPLPKKMGNRSGL